MESYVVRVRNSDKSEWGTSHWAADSYSKEDAEFKAGRLATLFKEVKILKQIITYEEVDNG
jgi:hypothetical protein